MVSLDDRGLRLTSANDGVLFDLVPGGEKEQPSWTRAGTSDAFLVLDRDGNGQVDSGRELFGSMTEQPLREDRSGFAALAVLDVNGDGRIDELDPVYSDLRLWIDANHNGSSEPEELQSLPRAGVISFSLKYRQLSRSDSHGNVFRFAAPVKLRIGRRVVVRQAYDVFLVGK